MKKIAGIEAGGTKINCGIGLENGEIIDMITIPTTTPYETISKIVEYLKNKEFDVIGLASFGPIDPIKTSKTYGYITSTPKANWANFNFVGELKKYFNVPIIFDTDVNAAALAESIWGSGKNLKNLLYITVGTGVGAGAIIDSKTIKGLTHPEMGHIFIKKYTDFKGICSYHGDCLEGLVSGPAIEKFAGKNAKLIEENSLIWDIVAEHLSEALISYILILSPQKIVLGGGVMKQQHLFNKIRKKVLKKLNSYIQKDEIINNIEEYITYPELGEFAGFYGSIALGI